ncbi:WD40 repeat domain containing protein [Aphelenchoides besseyi]|nr:WD40 repeat domain containing protein [Aphelenchoides besseyi]KAI6194703.1 WD40 repeat domain containing protein [Aphelenchoides besseyi]
MECCSTTYNCDFSRVPGLSNAKKPDSAFCTSNGVFLFIANGGKLYIYNIKTCELLKIVINQRFSFKNVHLCPNDLYVAVRTENGEIFVYFMSQLLDHEGIGEKDITPHRSFSSHRQTVSDLCFSQFDSKYLMSVGLDHQMVFTNIEAGQEVFKLSVDVPLTACAMSPTDSTYYLGTENGRLIIIHAPHAFEYAKRLDVVRNGAVANTVDYSVHDKHSGSSIISIAVNFDGSRLATADPNGLIVIWDTSNGQMISSHPHQEMTSKMITRRSKHQAPKKFDRDVAEKLNPIVTPEVTLPEKNYWVVEKNRQKQLSARLAKIAPKPVKKPPKQPNRDLEKHARLIADVRLLQQKNKELRRRTVELSNFAATHAT